MSLRLQRAKETEVFPVEHNGLRWLSAVRRQPQIKPRYRQARSFIPTIFHAWLTYSAVRRLEIYFTNLIMTLHGRGTSWLSLLSREATGQTALGLVFSPFR